MNVFIILSREIYKMANMSRKGVVALPSTKDKREETSPEEMIIDVLPQSLDREDSDKTDKDISKQNKTRSNLREDL